MASMSTPMMATPMVQATPSMLGAATPGMVPSISHSSLPHKPSPSSMSEIVLAPLSELQSLAQTLFQSLAPAQTKPPPPPSVTAFLEADLALAEAVRLARKHQIRQRRIERLMDEVLVLEERWRDVIQGLQDSKRELEDIISEGDERLQAIEEAKNGAVPYPELLSYAQRIALFTSAPPNMPDSLDPNLPNPPNVPLFFPPFPNEEKMRRGRMNDEAPLGIIGESHSVGKPPTISPHLPMDQGMAAANPYRPDMSFMSQPPQVFDLDLDLNPDL